MDILCSLLDFPDLVVLIALATGLHRRVPSIAGGASSSLVLRLRQLSKSWLDFVEQGDGALRSALVRVLEQTLQRRELADAHLLRELQICKDKLPEDGKACSFCSSTPGSTDVPARCAHQDRDRDADRPGLYTWIRTVANDPSAPAGLLLALHDEVSRSSIAISW